MFKLLNKHQQAKEESEQADSTADQDAANASSHDGPSTLNVPTPSSAASSAAHESSGSFDLSSSPLGLVTSISSSLLHSAGRSAVSAAKKAHQLGRNVTEEVKKGMEKGVEGIERATGKKQKRREDDHTVEEEDEEDGKDFDAAEDAPQKETEESSWYTSESKSSRRNWNVDDSQQLEEEKYGEDAASDDEGGRHSRRNSTDGMPQSSASELSLLRMNFLRLLQRCEETSFTHLHPSAGTSPLLSSSPSAARGFLLSVARLREMLGEMRKRRATVQVGKENGGFVRRVAFLATLAEKDALPTTRVDRLTLLGEQKSSFLGGSAAGGGRRIPNHPMSIAERQTKALLETASAAARAAESSESTVAPVASSSSSSSSFDDPPSHLRSKPIVDRGLELRSLLFARAAQRDGSLPGTRVMSREFQHEMEQRELVGELHDMTDSLKQNALRLRQALQTDAKVLNEVDDKLDGNLHSIKHENSRLKKWASTGCSEMCWNILLIVVLWTVFIFMFLFMKIFPAPARA